MVQPAISISTRVTGREVIVSVKDTGEGIDPKIRPKLFKIRYRFFPRYWVRFVYSKSVVEAHGGRMWTKDSTDRSNGATFYFSLPHYES